MRTLSPCWATSYPFTPKLYSPPCPKLPIIHLPHLQLLTCDHSGGWSSDKLPTKTFTSFVRKDTHPRWFIWDIKSQPGWIAPTLAVCIINCPHLVFSLSQYPQPGVCLFKQNPLAIHMIWGDSFPFSPGLAIHKPVQAPQLLTALQFPGQLLARAEGCVDNTRGQSFTRAAN